MKPNHSLMENCKTNAYLQLSVRICPCWRRIRREVCSQGQGQTQAGPQHDSQPIKHWRVIRFKEYDIDIVSIVDTYLVKIYGRGVLIACKIRVCVLIVIRPLFVDFSFLRSRRPYFLPKWKKKIENWKKIILRPLIHIFLPRFSVF